MANQKQMAVRHYTSNCQVKTFLCISMSALENCCHENEALCCQVLLI